MLAGAPHRDFTPSRLMVEKQTLYEAQNDVCSLWGEEGEVSLSRDRFRLREGLLAFRLMRCLVCGLRVLLSLLL